MTFWAEERKSATCMDSFNSFIPAAVEISGFMDSQCMALLKVLGILLRKVTGKARSRLPQRMPVVAQGENTLSVMGHNRGDR